MTKEEAIQELQNCKGLIQQDGQDYLDERDIPLLDMAIESLSVDAEPKWSCTANFVAEQLNKLEDMTVNEKLKLPQDLLGVEFKEENLNYEHATLVDIKEPLVKHDREWIIGCIKHDGFIKTDRFDKANQIILEALSADTVSREEYEEVKAYMDTLVDAFIEDGEELAQSVKVVRCKDCRHLDVWNLKNIYAVCSKHSITFEPFEDDTRTHFCSWGERRKSEKEYLDKTFPEHDGGEWFDITDMMTGESKK